MTAALGSLSTQFKACPADGVRTEFGVCRGGPIRHIQDLILGDTFLPKRHTAWLSVSSSGPEHDTFLLDQAANLPKQKLITLAELIFMTTTGQRLDVFAAVFNGTLFFISDRGFQPGLEYVLIDIKRREDAVIPAMIPMDGPETIPADFGRPTRPAAVSLRLIG